METASGVRDKVIIYVDKTLLRVTGVEVKGLRPIDLERVLTERLGSSVRVIGVSGDSIDMDVYGLEPEALRRDADGIITAVAAIPGVRATELARIESAERIQEVDVERLPGRARPGCRAERWICTGEQGGDHTDG